VLRLRPVTTTPALRALQWVLGLALSSPPTEPAAFDSTPHPTAIHPRLSLPQIVRFALDNPLVHAAAEDVESMKAELRKARFAWIPTIDLEATLIPGIRFNCDDVQLQLYDPTPSSNPNDEGPPPFDFQYCHTEDDGETVDVQTISGYFDQLRDAGVRFEIQASTIVPITTFGKLRNVKRTAKVAVDLQKLKQLQTEQETVLRVAQAHTTLVLTRESQRILSEAKQILAHARERVEADLPGENAWDTDVEQAPKRDPDDRYKMQLAEVEIEELSLKANKVEAVALAALRALAGRSAPDAFDIAEEVQLIHRIRGGLLPLSEYQQLAMTERPEARMAAAAVQARRYQEKLARANFLPDLGLVLRFAYAISTSADTTMNQYYYLDGFNYSRFTAALALRWRLDFHIRMFDLQRARATRRSSEYQREAARLMLAQEVEQTYRDLLEAIALIELEERAVALSWKLVVSAQQKDTVGGGNATEVIRQLEKWYRSRFELAEATQRHNEALARLSRAVGTQLAELETEGSNSPAP